MYIKVFIKVTVQINKSTDWSQHSGFRHSYIYIYIEWESVRLVHGAIKGLRSHYDSYII